VPVAGTGEAGRSDTPGYIVAVGPAGVDHLFTAIIGKLRAAGHEVRRYLDPAAFLAEPGALATADVLLAIGELACGQALMQTAPRLRAIVSPYTGTSGFDEAAATAFGILVANGHAPENYESMAEATVLLMLTQLYDLHGSEQALRQNRPRGMDAKARMLAGKTVGLIGFGSMGQAVARRLAGWGVHLQTFSPRTPHDIHPEVTRVPLETLLRSSDVVAVVTALTPATRHLLNAERLSLLKPDAVLVNTARGAIIDEAALCRLAAANPGLRIALDVFEREPLPAESKLRDLGGAVLTPHMLGHTQESITALQEVAAESVLRALAGVVPRHVRNPEVLPIWLARWSSR